MPLLFSALLKDPVVNKALFFFFAWIFLFINNTHAQLAVGDEQLDELAHSKQWRHLLHYRYHPYTGKTQSQNDSDDFFLASNGKKSLVGELKADLTAFLETDKADNQSAQCQFPARYYWLKTQLPQLNWQDQPCSEFTTWQQELEAHSITVIFPASHINSPSSMYGHTLVRLDRDDEKRSKLLAYSVNFAANADPTDNELVFSWKGLSGGYPGVVSVLPYYAKTNEYSHMEYRDIWEYQLDLTADEVAQFVRHTWETKDTYFDYYFFDENCSYRLLALLDASSERIDLADQFNFVALPVDTVRALQVAGLVQDKEYRPSAASTMEHKSSQATSQALAAAKQIVDSDQPIEHWLAPLTAQERTQALELAHSYARYLSIKKRKASPELRAKTVAILSARAKQSESTGFSEIDAPKYSDDQGHKSQRLSIKAGVASNQQNSSMKGFADIGWRIAFHEVMDLPQAFAHGAQIEMGEINVRAWDGGKVRLQQLKLLDILSLSEQTYFQRPIAWSVSTGLERFVGENGELYAYLKTGFGKAWKAPVGRVYGMGEVQLLADNQFHNGAQLSAGPRVGWLWQTRAFQAQLEGNYQGLAVIDKTKITTAKAQLGWRLDDNLQLRLSAQQQWFNLHGADWNNEEFSLGVNWYF